MANAFRENVESQKWWKDCILRKSLGMRTNKCSINLVTESHWGSPLHRALSGSTSVILKWWWFFPLSIWKMELPLNDWERRLCGSYVKFIFRCATLGIYFFKYPRNYWIYYLKTNLVFIWKLFENDIFLLGFFFL